MTNPVIKVNGFTKRYGSSIAVENLSFAVEEGELFALLGPNGAGKTSTLECLEGLRHPDAGSLSICGIDPVREHGKLRNLIGVQLQSAALPQQMTPVEALCFFCAWHRVAPRLALLDEFGLSERLKAPFASLSTGQQRRLALALATAHAPRVLILDEPTAGLDVEARAELHALLLSLKREGTTIILATHDMAEVERLADRAAILVRGRLAATGSPRELTAAGDARTRVTASTAAGSLARFQPPQAVPLPVPAPYQGWLTHDSAALLRGMLAHLEQSGDALLDLRVERPTLEERFLEIIKAGPGQAPNTSAPGSIP